MWKHKELAKEELTGLLKKANVQLGGNARLKIYGLLSCKSGKRMKRENRVFFKNETEAVQLGFRPCGHCMPADYQNWKLLS